MSKEMVNHPSHYQKAGHKECIVEMEDMFGVQNVAMFCYMTSFKYLYRMGDKDGNSAEQDYDKACWYFDYVEQLAEKWHTDTFDARMKQQIEQGLKEGKKKLRKIKKAEKGLGFDTSADEEYLARQFRIATNTEE